MFKFLNNKKKVRKKQSYFLETKDILSDLIGHKGSSLFVGKYSLNEVLAVLRKRSFVKDAQKRNLWPLDYKMDSSEFPVQKFQIFYKECKPENLIVDLKIKEGRFIPRKKVPEYLPFSEYKFLMLEWLTLQNPLLSFSKDTLPLPGQKHPGLNLSRKVIDVFIYLARLNKTDGILAFPAYFHNAILFSRYFHFLDPGKEAEVMAIRKAAVSIPFKQLAWIVYLNCLRREDGMLYEWIAEEQVHPLNSKLKKYFNSNEYKDEVKNLQGNLHFSIDWDTYNNKMSQLTW